MPEKNQRKPEKQAAPLDGSDFPIVGIGASAGGLESFKRLLRVMPPDTGIAFVLIQHLDPDHESRMADLLSKYTSMPVLEVQNATRIEPNHVYMIPPNKYIKVEDGGLFLEEAVKRRGMRMAIDHFFRSLAESKREASIGIVLSGTGTDGTLGLKEVKAHGGMAMVQKPETAEYDGMPRSAIATGLADFVLPIEDMPDVLVNYVRHPYVDGTAAGVSLEETAPDHLRSIVNILRAHADYDFRSYKKGTLHRRVQRRMGLRHIENVGSYLELLRRDPDEVRALFKDLLIGVTRFFRDREAWAALQGTAVATIVKEHDLREPVRVWVPGCSTGEEAFTLAMLFFEEFDRQETNPELQLFATDLDEDSIERGRAGLYPASIGADVGPERLKRFFVDDGAEDGYRVSKRLREAVVFAVQNLIIDPPFSNLDLICCRNLLIYLEADFQRRLFELFHFALRKDGFLFLGSAETVGDPNLFTSVSQSWRIYRKRGQARRGTMRFPVVPNAKRLRSVEDDDETQRLSSFRTIEAAKQSLLDSYAPASVVVSRGHEIHYYQGRLRDYLDLPRGEPTQDLLAMVVDGLRSRLRGLMQKALRDDERVEAVVPRVKQNNSSRAVRLVAEPLPSPEGGEPMLLVSFLEEPRGSARTSLSKGRSVSKKTKGTTDDVEEESLIEQLQYELDATRHDLQSTIEELETSNEEMKASNEQIVSMNEELQSTNEELETSREELQSLNEELSTMNNELEDKVAELESTNNDLTNLLDSTEIATIFLDTNLRIRRFTPAATELLNVIDTDAGRPIDDLSPRVNDPDLLEDARAVMQKLHPREKEVYGSGNWFLRRILPYRTSENHIDGVVVTFTEVSKLKETTRRLEARERQQAVVASLGRLALTASELQELFDEAVTKTKETLGVELSKILELMPDGKDLLLRAGAGWEDGLVGTARAGASMGSQAGYTLHARGPVVVQDLPTERRFRGPPLLTRHDVVSGMSVIIGKPEEPWGVLGAHSTRRVDFTVDDVNFLQGVAHLLGEAIARRRIEAQLRNARHRLQSIADSVPILIAHVNDEQVFEFNNARYEEWFGINRDKLRGQPMRDVLGKEIYETIEPFVDRALAGETVSFERTQHRADGEVRDILVSYTPSRDDRGKTNGFFIAIADVTDVKKAEESVRLSQEAGGVGTWDWDVQKGRAECSEEYFRIYGVPPREDFSYADWMSHVHPEDRPEVERRMSKALAGEEDYDVEFRIVRPDGEARWVTGKGRVMFFDERGQGRRMLGVSTDITQRKHLELGLRKAQEELQKASELKDEFLALLGHELRNPLGAIANGVQLLRSEDASEHRAWAEKMLERQVGHLGRLVDDLLDLTRITRGQIEIRKQLVELKSLVEGTIDSLRDLIDGGGHVVDIALPADDVYLYADPARIEQVVSNLLTNAIKYTEVEDAGSPGRIEVRVTTMEGEAVVRVADSGIGIRPEDLDAIFEPFVRVSEKLDRAGSGLGIGLTLVKKLVELHEGTIEARSEGSGKGAEFVVRLPLVAAADPADIPPPDEAAPRSHRELRVLIIDDNQDLAEGLRKRLRGMGHEVEVAYEGKAGIERARELRPHAILVDVGLPGLDGYQVAEKLRSAVPGKLWVAAISGYKQDEEREVASKLFDHYFVKPVDFEELRRVLPGLGASPPGGEAPQAR